MVLFDFWKWPLMPSSATTASVSLGTLIADTAMATAMEGKIGVIL